MLVLRKGELDDDDDEAERIFGEEVNVTVEGKRHLGAVIGSKNYKDQFCNEKISKWKEELETLVDGSQRVNHNQPISHLQRDTSINLPTSCEQSSLLKTTLILLMK